jgi:RND family efflux transporter MFP subunit
MFSRDHIEHWQSQWHTATRQTGALGTPGFASALNRCATGFASAYLGRNLVIILGVMAGCRWSEPPSTAVSAPPPPKVLVSHPIERPLAETRDYTGHLDAVEAVAIRARVRGVLQTIHFKEGAEVEQGSLLYEIDPSEFQALVDEQAAEIERLTHESQLAETEAKRSSELFALNATPKETWESKQTKLAVTKAELEKARAALKQAELNLSYTKIHSPISGRIGRTLVTEGNLVGYNEPTLLTNVVKMDPVYVYFEIPERDLLRLEEVGQRDAASGAVMQAPLSAGLETEAGHPHEGVADFRDNKVDSETGTVLIRATLKNPDRRLVPGLFARIRMAMGQPQPRLLVPETSLAADQRGRYVLIVKPNDVVEQRPVQIEKNLGPPGFLVVRAGVVREDRVIVSGIQKARPGAKVDPELIEPGDDMSVADAESAGATERH